MGALLFALLPALLYTVTNLGPAWDLKHVWSLLLLSSAPLLMLTTMKVRPQLRLLCCHLEMLTGSLSIPSPPQGTLPHPISCHRAEFLT